LYFLPVYIITLAAGGVCEAIFAIVRKHPIAEGFLVSSMLFPLILPPMIPWWQVVLGIAFGIVIGKEVFGGVGMNILNPALTARVFLYFAYPGEISGDKVWVAVDGYSRATPLGEMVTGMDAVTDSWMDSFLGLIPGSMGETSTLACLIGAVILISTKVGSWRVMLGCLVGMGGFAYLLNAIGSDTNPMFAITPEWHLVTGGFAFGAVFMATDPVSAAHTRGGQIWYGLLVGMLTVLVRVINPGFPEGIMLAILFGNVFAPVIDKIYVNKNVKRRQLRNVAG
jgi:Na+-transporting NADH:ubiquinone oxidoreductase subunit B